MQKKPFVISVTKLFILSISFLFFLKMPVVAGQIVAFKPKDHSTIPGVVDEIYKQQAIKVLTIKENPFKPGDILELTKNAGKVNIILGRYKVIKSSPQALILDPLKTFATLGLGTGVNIALCENQGQGQPIRAKGPNPGAMGQGSYWRRVGKEADYQKRAKSARSLPGIYWPCYQRCILANQSQDAPREVIENGCMDQCKEKEKKAPFETALDMLASSDQETYSKGIRMLCRMDDPRAVRPLISALEREFQQRTGLWAWIIPALGRSGNLSATAVLIQALNLKDESWMGRKKAASALGQLANPLAIPALMDASRNDETRNAALEALSNFRDKRLVPMFIKVLFEDQDQDNLETAIMALHDMGPMAIPEMINKFSSSSSHAEGANIFGRQSLCHLLGRSGDKRALSALRKAKNDPNKKIRACVLRYLK